MRSLKNDKLIVSVVYKQDGAIVTKSFNSFAAAAGHADALSGITRFINAEFKSPAGDSSWSGSLHCINTNNERRICNRVLVEAVLNFETKNK